MITRTSLANEIDEYDQQIADMNTGKKDCFDAYRAQLVASGMDKENIKTEIEAVKAAIKRRRAAKKDPMAVEEKDALIDEIFEEIMMSPRAPRATREIIEKFSTDGTKYDATSGEILEDINPRLAKQVVDGMQTEAGRAALMTAVDIMIEREEAEEQNLESPRKAAEAVPERAATQGATIASDLVEAVKAEAVAGGSGQPEVIPALTRQFPGVDVDGAESAGVTVGGDESGTVSNYRSDGGLNIVHKHTEIASASHGEAEAPSVERVSPAETNTGSAAANTGGNDVDSSAVRAGQSDHTSNSGEEPRQSILPVKHRFRPNCQNRDHCRSGTADHCHSCKVAMREREDA
jgi:hypothetical protein